MTVVYMHNAHAMVPHVCKKGPNVVRFTIAITIVYTGLTRNLSLTDSLPHRRDPAEPATVVAGAVPGHGAGCLRYGAVLLPLPGRPPDGRLAGTLHIDFFAL